MKRYHLECDTSGFIIDHPIEFKAIVRDTETGESIKNATIVGGGGNLRFCFDTQTPSTTGNNDQGPRHLMAGNTPLFAIINEGTGVSEIVGPILISNVDHQKIIGNNLLEGSQSTNVGTETIFKHNGVGYWDEIKRDEYILTQEEDIIFDFPVCNDLAGIHIILRWYNFNHAIDAQVTSPDGKVEHLTRIQVSDKKGNSYLLPVIQPSNDGIISNPLEGKWQIKCSKADKNIEKSVVFAEIYEKRRFRAPITEINYRIFNENEILDSGVLDDANQIKFTPNKKGECTIELSKPGVIRTEYFSFTVE